VTLGNGPDASIRDIMQAQIGCCPHRNDPQIYPLRSLHCSTLVRLFGIPAPD